MGEPRRKVHEPIGEPALRPYRGYLIEEHYHDIMGAVRALAPTMEEDKVDRALMSCLWSIVFLAEAWALDPGGMLRRNSLINEVDQARLRGWVRTIQWAVMHLLDDRPDAAFEFYDQGTTWC